ncbi:MAG: hypothetical protein ACI9JK_000022 [Phycisphaerales bacterium]|jgi:hypothetical protein
MQTVTSLLLCFFLGGCAYIATYPPVESDVILSNPNSANEPVPTILAEVLLYAHSQYGGMDIIVFNLPKGMTPETYSIVSNKLGGAVPLTIDNQVAYHITELRVRGLSAEADITFPSPSGGYEEASIRLTSAPFEHWAVSDSRVWLIPSKTPPSPNILTSGSTIDE